MAISTIGARRTVVQMRSKFYAVLVSIMFCLLLPGFADANTLVDSSKALNGPIYFVSNPEIETIEFPNLERVNGPIYIVNNTSLKSVRFPKLAFVNGPVYMTYNPALAESIFSTGLYVNGPLYYFMNGTDAR